jgi:hypothetical protein
MLRSQSSEDIPTCPPTLVDLTREVVKWACRINLTGCLVASAMRWNKLAVWYTLNTLRIIPVSLFVALMTTCCGADEPSNSTRAGSFVDTFQILPKLIRRGQFICVATLLCSYTNVLRVPACPSSSITFVGTKHAAVRGESRWFQIPRILAYADRP